MEIQETHLDLESSLMEPFGYELAIVKRTEHTCRKWTTLNAVFRSSTYSVQRAISPRSMVATNATTFTRFAEPTPFP
jgi:hypothetical protein